MSAHDWAVRARADIRAALARHGVPLFGSLARSAVADRAAYRAAAAAAAPTLVIVRRVR